MQLVFYPQTNKESALPIYISGVGVNYNQSRIYRPALMIKQILMTISGCGTLTVGGQTYSVPEGTGFYLNGSVEHTYEPVGDKPWIVDWVTFEVMADGLDLLTFTSKDFVLFNFKRPIIMSDYLIKIMESVSRDDVYGGFSASALMYSMIIGLNREIMDLPERAGKSNAAISAAIEYINNHYSEDVSLEKLCEVSGGLSEQYFCRLFKQHTGLRPIEFLLRKRIGVASGYLEKTDMPISEVAEITGFNNTSYFYRNFKKFTGMSPLNCRQNALYYKELLNKNTDV